jgi:hypothetical protein
VVNFVNPGSGTVELFDLSLDTPGQLNSLQPGNFVLARLVFDTVAAGTSGLDLTVNALGDADGNPLSVGLQKGSATVNAVSTVPEPSSFLLLAACLAAIAIAVRRRERVDVSRI